MKTSADAPSEKDLRAARRQLGRGEKWALRATLFCGVTLLIALPFLLRRNVAPSIVIPSPAPLPNPNAFDFYVQAGTMIVPAPVAAYKKDAPFALLQSTAKDNAPALRVFRKGLAFPYQQPAARGIKSLTMAPYAKFRELARQINFEARVLAAGGDWNGAMQSRLDGMRLGNDIPRGGAIISLLVGIAMEAIARQDADEIVPHLTAAQARAAAQRLEKLYESRVSLAEVWTEDKWVSLTMMQEGFSTPGWRGQMSSSWREKARWYFVDPQQMLDNRIKVLDAQIANVRLPYGTPGQPLPQPNDPYSQMLGGALSENRFRFSSAKNQTGNALLLSALALRAYQAEHGDLPKTLNDLAPSYLKNVPIDPFGNGKPLRYVRKNAREYSLYSVGSDGRDDGGKIAKTRSGKTRRYISPEDRGDMVLGING